MSVSGDVKQARTRSLWVRYLGGLLLGCLAVWCGTSISLAQGVGAIRGTVYDPDFDVPMAEVRVTILELGISVRTADAGNYVFEEVPPGSYTLIFNLDGFQRLTRRNVVVSAGRLADVPVEMNREVFEIEEFRVTGTDLFAGSELAQLELRQDSSLVQDAISSELISKAGASDVGGALKLVVGASVRDGKYATVRGLSDRYTGTTLNGLRIPSADPRRRAVQIDLFPTGTVDAITVTKTFRPDLQGDFTGGGVDIKTKSIPDGFTLNVGASYGWDSIATGEEDFVTYRGGGTTFLGTDSSRDLPDAAQVVLPSYTPLASPGDADVAIARQYDDLTNAFTPSLGTARGDGEANQSFSIVVGDRYELPGGPTVGLIGAVTHSRGNSLYLDAPNNVVGTFGPDGQANLNVVREDSNGTDSVLLGALGTLVVQFNDRHQIDLRAVANQSADDNARIQTITSGFSIGFPRVAVNQSILYTERNVRSNQLAGSHRLPNVLRLGRAEDPGLRIDWSYASSETEQDQPDARFIFYRFQTEALVGDFNIGTGATESDLTRRLFSNISEDNDQFRIDLTLPFDKEGEFKFGYFNEDSDRDYRQDGYFYSFPVIVGSFANPEAQRAGEVLQFQGEFEGQLWTDVFLDQDRVGLWEGQICEGFQTPFSPFPGCLSANQLTWRIEYFGRDVQYDGTAGFEGIYGMAEIPVSERLSIVAGARLESTDIEIVTRGDGGTIELGVRGDDDRFGIDPGADESEGNAAIDQSQLLPAINATYKIRDDMNLRGAFTQTIARPTFRELSAVATTEFLFGDEFIGNPELTLSEIENYDLRWEWFRGEGDVLAVSAFYKELRNPIEYISFQASNRDFVQPINFETGTVEGLEFEARTALDFISDRFEGLAFAVNYAVLETAVDVPVDEQERLAAFGLDEEERRLQGQPEFLFNANVTYDNDDLGISMGLFYNRTGDVLLSGAAVGDDGKPNVFDREIDNLDFSFQKRWDSGVSLRLRARNLTQPDRETLFRLPTGEEVTRTKRETPLRLSVSAAYKF